MTNVLSYFLVLLLMNMASCKNISEKTSDRFDNSSIKGISESNMKSGICDLIVISDLDDTIKISHSSSKVSTIGHGLFDDRIYAGMNALFNAFFRCNQKYDTNFFIVSSAPQFLGDKINDLLEKHHFPKAETYLRDWMGADATYEFKVKTITDILNKTNSPVILIGDDTSKDPLVYTEIKKRFPEKVSDVYIHRITAGSSVPADFVSFYTTFDITLNEVKKGRLEEYELLNVAGLILSSEDRDEVIPHFGLCPKSLLECGQFHSKPNIESICQNITKKITEACREIDD